VCQVNFTAIFYHKRASLASIPLDLLISWFWVLLSSREDVEAMERALEDCERTGAGEVS